MENASITCRVLTFCSNISENADKLSHKHIREGNKKYTRDRKGPLGSKDDNEKSLAKADKETGDPSKNLKDAHDAHYILTLQNGDSYQYKAEAKTLHSPNKAKKRFKETLNIETDKIVEKKAITVQPKKQISKDETKLLVCENLTDLIKKQSQKGSKKLKVNHNRNKLTTKKPQRDVVKKNVIRDVEKVTEQPRKNIIMENSKHFFMRNQNEKTNDHFQKQIVEIYQNYDQDLNSDKDLAKDVSQKNIKENCVKLKEIKGKIKPYISKSVDDFYFNRSNGMTGQNNTQRRAKIKTNKKRRTRRKTINTQKPSRRIHLFKVPSKLPVKRKKTRAKFFNLDYFRRKMSFHVNSSSFNLDNKQATRKKNAKAKAIKKVINKSQKLPNTEVLVLFRRKKSKPTSSKKNLNLRRSQSSDIFGFRKSNWSSPMVYKCNERRSAPNMQGRACSSVEHNFLDSNAYLPCLAKKVKKNVCHRCHRQPVLCIVPSESKRNVCPSKEKRCDVQTLCQTEECEIEVCSPQACQPKERPVEVRPPKARPPRERKVPCPVIAKEECICDKNTMNPYKAVPCQSRFKTIDFPKDGMGDKIVVYRLNETRKKKSGKTCGNKCKANYSRKICCNGEGDVSNNNNSDSDQSICKLKPESALMITIRSCLICMVMLCWLPCILVVFLYWLITYPMRPHARENKEKKPLLETFVCWIRSAKWFNLSAFDVFWSMIRQQSCHKLERTTSMPPSPALVKEPISVCCMTQSQSPCKSSYPNRNRKYTLAHTTSRGWVMRVMREKKMPPSILKKEGQSNRTRRPLNFGTTPCPPGPIREAPKVSRRCHAGMQAICVEQRVPAVRQVTAALTKCSCSQVSPKTNQRPSTHTNKKSSICTCRSATGNSVCNTRAAIGVCYPKPKPTRKRKISFYKKCCRRWKNACREFVEFEKGNYDPNATCGEMYFNTMRNKPCFWLHDCCPNMYPFFLQLCSMYRNCCHGLLLLISACIWVPWMLCCYICIKCCCGCFSS